MVQSLKTSFSAVISRSAMATIHPTTGLRKKALGVSPDLFCRGSPSSLQVKLIQKKDCHGIRCHNGSRNIHHPWEKPQVFEASGCRRNHWKGVLLLVPCLPRIHGSRTKTTKKSATLGLGYNRYNDFGVKPDVFYDHWHTHTQVDQTTRKNLRKTPLTKRTQ